MNHPDWEYGDRPSREKRAPDARFTPNHPGGQEPPYGSVADTSSLEPSPEALGWARQADEWAQPDKSGRPAPDREVPGLRPSEWRPAHGEAGQEQDRHPAAGPPPASSTVYGTPIGPAADPYARAQPFAPAQADPSATIPNIPAPDLPVAGGRPRPAADRMTDPWQEPTQPRGWAPPGAPQGHPPTDWRGISDEWRAEPDSGSWSPGPGDWSTGEDRQNGWRTGPEPAPGGAPWRDGGAEPWRRDPRPAADPWAQSAADSGVIPMSWEEPAADTGSWRSPAGWPAPRSPWDDGPTARVSDSWRHRHHPWQGEDDPWDAPRPPHEESESRSHLRPAESQPGPNDAVTEIRQSIGSDRWHRAGMPPAGAQPAPGHVPQGPHNERGSATYLGGAGDWRRDLAMRSDLADGESRRYGTQDYRPAGPALGRTYSGVAGSANGARATASTANGHPVAGTPSTGLAGILSAVDDDETDDNSGSVLAAIGYTIIWYGVPVVLFVFYVLVFGSRDRAHALTTLAGAAPQFGLSLLVSVVIAVALRWLVTSWRAASVGLAAAVLGGGLATVLVSAITGHSLT